MLTISRLCLVMIGLVAVVSSATAAPKGPPVAPPAPLSAQGEAVEKKYAAELAALRAEIIKALPAVADGKKAALKAARDAAVKATAEASAAQQALGKIHGAKGLIDHAKGKWIGGADKGIAQAEAALKKATTDAEREAAKAELAKWQANKADGMKALEERTKAYEKAKADEPRLVKANQAAQAALAKARTDEMTAAKAILAELDPFLSSDAFDGKLSKAVVLTAATPRGLAEFAEKGSQQTALVEKLLGNDPLMKEMLVAGGAAYGKYGRAMQIYSAVQQASSKASEGLLQRLALAVALEHANPVRQSNAASVTNGPQTVDPVKRYLHYEKAWLNGELDPAFKNLSVWELRMVVDSDAPDEILAWGREMLRTYRPDHISNPNYGWRYVSAVKTDVRYGSQDVRNDDPALHSYQNIPKNGGVCGRRAFFGRFILKSFGIPSWGVTQHKHAALSHWTPKGWVVNLGAGFGSSWWDKAEVSRSGSSFVLETQAREHASDYLKVLRAAWVSRILGEPAYNERKKVEGGFWSRMAHYQTMILASQAVELGPLGQELAEANATEEKETVEIEAITAADQASVNRDGAIIVSAVGYTKPSGRAAAMKSSAGGKQLHVGGGFKAEYVVEVPKAGKYKVTARVATLQEGQVFEVTTGSSAKPVEIKVPYTIGLWKDTPPVEVTLSQGKNVIQFAVKDGSRGVTIKDFALTPQ